MSTASQEANAPVGALQTDRPRVPREPTRCETTLEACSRRIFPFQCFCCPCLPSSWTKIQDWLHLVLIIGILASLLCIVQLIWELAVGTCQSPFCFKQIISGVCVLPSTVYFVKTVGQYDEQLKEKQQRHQEEVEHLIENINEQVAEMNDLCKKVTENANEFAMGRFNDKCQQFLRFLKGIKAHYNDLYADDAMFEQLREFVITWFNVFAGSLINPDQNPAIRDVHAELMRCVTVQEICDVAIKRLQGCKVAFEFQMPAQAPLLPMTRRGASSVSPGTSVAGVMEEGGAAAGMRQSLVSDARTVGPERRCGMSWLHLHCGRCGCDRSSGPTGYPLTIFTGCVRLRVLSRTHANLLVAFSVDILLVLFELLETRWPSLILVIVNEVCVTSMLACFEQINEIAQLEQQIHVYEQRNAEVGRRRDEARNAWEKVQQLHDLWLYRTLPSLSILGKIHNHLADEDLRAKSEESPAQDGRLDFLRLANESFHCVERKLGTLESWRESGPLAMEWKESIGKQLKDCEGESDVHELVGKLPIITSDLRALEAPPPSMTPATSPSGSFATSSSGTGAQSSRDRGRRGS